MESLELYFLDNEGLLLIKDIFIINKRYLLCAHVCKRDGEGRGNIYNICVLIDKFD